MDNPPLENPEFDDNAAFSAPEAERAAQQPVRMRATSDMITLQYRFKQFLKKGGAELFFILLSWLLVRNLLSSSGLLNSFARRDSGNSMAIPLAISRIFHNTMQLSAMPAFFFSLLAICGLFFASRKIGSPETGIAAAILTALFPLFSISGFQGFSQIAAFALLAYSLLFLLRSNEGESTINAPVSGLLWISGLSCTPALFPIALALTAGALSRKTVRKSLPGFLIGTAAGFLLIEILLQSLLGKPVFSGLKLFFSSAGVTGAAPGSLFPRLFSSPTLAPFSLIALFALGYTARAGSGSFPVAPAIIFLTGYLLLDLLPVRSAPLRTLAGDGSCLTLPLTLLGGVFIGNLMDRKSLRWLIAAITTIAAAALLAAR